MAQFRNSYVPILGRMAVDSPFGVAGGPGSFSGVGSYGQFGNQGYAGPSYGAGVNAVGSGGGALTPSGAANPLFLGSTAATQSAGGIPHAQAQAYTPPVALPPPPLPYSMTPLPRQPIGGMWNQQAQQMAGPTFNRNPAIPQPFNGQLPQGQPSPMNLPGTYPGHQGIVPSGSQQGPINYLPLTLAALGGGS